MFNSTGNAILPQPAHRGVRLPIWAGLFALAGCAGGPADEPTHIDGAVMAAQTQVKAPPPPRVDLEYYILAGEMAIQRGQPAEAAEAYVAALRYSDDPALAKRATRIALFSGDPNLAYRAAEAWSKADPADPDAHKTAARLALRAGSRAQLAEHAAAVVELYSAGTGAGFLELADVLSGEPQSADMALSVMSDLVARHPDLPKAQYAKGLLAFRYDRLQMANSAVQRALGQRPDWAEALLLRAGILVSQGRLDEADAIVDRFRGSSDAEVEQRLAYARLLLEAEHPQRAADQYERVLQLEPGNVDARYGLGLLALTLGEYERAQKAFRALHDAGRRRDDAAFYLGAIAEQRRDYSLARRWYRKVNDGAHLFEAQVRAARTYYEQGDLGQARSELATLRRQRPDMAERLYVAEGELLYRAREYRQALALYNRALEQFPSDPDLLYARSLIWERLGEIDRAEADLRTVLAQEPSDPRALNALGYMLSNHSRRYQEALGYIRQALQAEPENPVIIDSMGWIQYRLGNLQEARDYLEQAYAEIQDPEVAAHLGEVLWKLGKRQRAREIWKRARAQDPNHPILTETVERLNP